MRHKFITHNDEEVCWKGCSLRGYVEATVSDITEVFGEPKYGDGYKTTREWHIKFEDECVATIYDWKEPVEGTEKKIVWHIGGATNDALWNVDSYLQNVIWGTRPQFHQPTYDPEQVAQQRAMVPSGCSLCGMAYSFHFGVQLHSEDCKRADFEQDISLKMVEQLANASGPSEREEIIAKANKRLKEINPKEKEVEK